MTKAEKMTWLTENSDCWDTADTAVLNEFAEVDDLFDLGFTSGIGEVASYLQIAVGIVPAALFAVDEVVGAGNIFQCRG